MYNLTTLLELQNDTPSSKFHAVVNTAKERIKKWRTGWKRAKKLFLKQYRKDELIDCII